MAAGSQGIDACGRSGTSYDVWSDWLYGTDSFTISFVHGVACEALDAPCTIISYAWGFSSDAYEVCSGATVVSVPIDIATLDGRPWSGEVSLVGEGIVDWQMLDESGEALPDSVLQNNSERPKQRAAMHSAIEPIGGSSHLASPAPGSTSNTTLPPPRLELE